MLCKTNRIHFSALSLYSNLCVGLLPKIKISFLLSSIFVYELISTPKFITFLPNLVPGNEKLPYLSNPIPYSEYFHLQISAFLVRLTAPNKQFSSVRVIADVSAFTYLINNINGYYFSMIKCNFILFQTASIILLFQYHNNLSLE